MQTREQDTIVPNINRIIEFLAAQVCSDTSLFIILAALGDTTPEFDATIPRTAFLELYATKNLRSVDSIARNLTYASSQVYRVSIDLVENFGSDHRQFFYAFMAKTLEICEHLKIKGLFQN